jgi:formyl-CoA transferase
VVADPQLRAAEAVIEIDHPTKRTIETINSPVFMEGVEKRTPTVAPEVGAHTREVLSEIGYSKEAIEKLIRSGAAASIG